MIEHEKVKEITGTEWLESLQEDAYKDNNGVLVFKDAEEMYEYFYAIDNVVIGQEVAFSPGVYFVNLYNYESDEYYNDFDNGKIDWTFKVAFNN